MQDSTPGQTEDEVKQLVLETAARYGMSVNASPVKSARAMKESVMPPGRQ